MELSGAQARVLDAIDEEALVGTLVELIRTPSVTGTDAESELQHVVARGMAEAGLEVDLWQLDLTALRADPRHPGEETDRSEGWGAVGTTPGDGVPALVLQGHVDVVPVGDPSRWEGRDPFGAEIAGSGSRAVVHGRGACDMKAGLAVNLEVARALHRSGVRLERPFGLHSVVSEEDGGLGSFGTMLRGHTAEAAVITEPTGGRVVVANAGALTFELRVPGRAAHGSTPYEGHSAIEAYLPLHRAIQELERERNAVRDELFGDNPVPYGIVVGIVRAGDWASNVPDLLVAEGRYGARLGEDPAAARAVFEAAIAAACDRDPWLRDHPATVTWPGAQFAPGAIEPGHPLIDETADAVAAITGGDRPPRVAAPYGSDLWQYTGLGGIPTLHHGPGDVRFAHAPREQVAVAEVVTAARAMALLAARRCGAH